MKFSVEVVGRGASLEQVRAIYFSQAFDDAVAQAANLISRTQIEHTARPDGTEKTRTRVVPRLALPAAIRKMALQPGTGSIAYEEQRLVIRPARR